jgi:uncharacterized protein YbjT (DUF2867 family)
MKTLVIGGTGTVGTGVVQELLARGADVAVLTRKPDAVKLPAGATPIGGDLLEPATTRRIFRGIDGVFMLNPVSQTETHEGLMGILGAQAAGVKTFVYLTIHRLEQAPHFPHFASKRPLESALRESGMAWTLVRPNNFFQNDYWFKEPLLNYGVYPQPIGQAGLSRVDVRDIAEVAAVALTQPGHDGKTYELAGPTALTGTETAAIWSRALNRPIAYGGDDMDAWEQQASTMLPPWMAYDFRLMYTWFQTKGLVATERELAETTAVLGHAPRSYEAFVQETARAWTG